MKRMLLVIGACSSPQHAHHEPQPEPHQHGMHHRFEHADEWAKVFDDPARDAWQQPDKVIAALELAPTLTVADVGAGTGYFSMRIAPLVHDVIATDIEPDMVRYMTERAAREHITNLRALVPPADGPGFDAVDRILIVDVWHHLDDRAAYAKKLAAALKPGGFVAVVDFKHESKHGPPPEHRLSPETISAELAAGGLHTTVIDTLPDQFIVIARR